MFVTLFIRIDGIYRIHNAWERHPTWRLDVSIIAMFDYDRWQ